MELVDFIERVSGFNALSAADKIPYFAYYTVKHKGKDSFCAKDIEECFNDLKYTSYSNISAFLSKKASQRSPLFIKLKKGGYHLERSFSDKIEETIGVVKIAKPSDIIFPMELLENTRAYLNVTATQAICCYDYGMYDASLVMLRKLLETLIIELFERYNISEKIKNPQTSNFYFLSDLVSVLLKETSWNLSRNTTMALPEIKKNADMSAHNRTYNAKKADIDNLKSGIRTVIQELVAFIDYPTWNKAKKPNRIDN